MDKRTEELMVQNFDTIANILETQSDALSDVAKIIKLLTERIERLETRQNNDVRLS